MSDTETLALIIATALGGIGIGLGITGIFQIRHQDRREWQLRATEAYARWLGARSSHSRSCWSFVEMKRKLRTSQPMSPVAAERRAEVNHVQEQWRQASSELDTAEALLVAWSRDLSTVDKIAEHPRFTGGDIQLAADAHSSELNGHHDRLEEQDRIAAESLRPSCDRSSPFGSGTQIVVRIAKGVVAFVDDMASRWAKR